MHQQHNQALPEVRAVTAERLRKCRSRINQAVRDGCLEQYLSAFIAAVKKAQATPFRLAAIPAMFRGVTFESYQARNLQQDRAVALMRSLGIRSVPGESP